MNIKASDANYNSFASEAFIFIGDVYLDLFAIKSLKTSLEGNKLKNWGLRVPIWNKNFCSSVLRLSELPRCKERPQTAICCLE